MIAWLRRMLGRADGGWDAVNERARAHLATVTKLSRTRAFSGDPVMERELQRAERIVRESAGKSRAR